MPSTAMHVKPQKEKCASSFRSNFKDTFSAVSVTMPPKQAVNLNLSDSSTYPDILPLWSRENVRISKPVTDMADLDPMDPVHVPYLDPWLSRMEVALRIATRAVISSSSFFLKVLCANVITLDSKRKAYDPNYIPTDADRREYRLMMDHLSTNHRLYVNDHGKFCPDTYGESQMTSNAKGYVWWTILNVWFMRHYNRPSFENLPESERRIVDFAVAVTIAHEFAHVVNNYRDWKELLEQGPYTHCSAKFINHMDNFNMLSEPCFSVRQWQPELGDAWEHFTFEGDPCFKDHHEQMGRFTPDLTKGIVWGKRQVTCNTLPSRTGSLAITDELDEERSVFKSTPIPETTIDRFLSKGCWDYVENLLRLDKIINASQVALVKEVQLFHVLKLPPLYDWLLFVPRHGVTQTRTYTTLQDELRRVIYAETHEGDTIADMSTVSVFILLTANLPGYAPTPSIMQNGARYILDPNQQAAGTASNQASQAFFALFAPEGSRMRQPRSSEIVKDIVEATSSKVEKASAAKSSKSKSKSSSSRSVGPRAKPKSAIK